MELSTPPAPAEVPSVQYEVFRPAPQPQLNTQYLTLNTPGGAGLDDIFATSQAQTVHQLLEILRPALVADEHCVLGDDDHDVFEPHRRDQAPRGIDKRVPVVQPHVRSDRGHALGGIPQLLVDRLPTADVIPAHLGGND